MNLKHAICLQPNEVEPWRKAIRILNQQYLKNEMTESQYQIKRRKIFKELSLCNQ